MDDRMPGFIYLHRSLLDSDIWTKPLWWGRVWEYLLLTANWEDGKICKEGEVFTTYEKIYAGCCFKRSEVPNPESISNVLKYLRNNQMITSRKTTRGMYISICKYKDFQKKQFKNNQSNNLELTGEKPDYIKEEKNKGKKGVSKKDTPKKKIFDLESEEMECCRYLAEHIKAMSANYSFPGMGKTKSEAFRLIQPWCKEFNKTLQKHPIDQIKIYLNHYFSDPDNKYIPVVRSPSALNEKWDKITDSKQRINGEKKGEYDPKNFANILAKLDKEDGKQINLSKY